MDVVHGPITTQRGQASATKPEGVGATEACAELDCIEERIQDLQHVCISCIDPP